MIAYLKNYAIGETPSININKAVAEAESHWQYIQSIDVNKRKANAIRELERSRNLLNSVKNLFDDGSDTAQIRDNLEGFKIRLDDLENYIYKSRNTTEDVNYFCFMLFYSSNGDCKFFLPLLGLSFTGYK